MQSAQANQGHFPLLLYFSFKERLFLAKIQFRWKVLSLISLCRLHMLIWYDTFRTCIKPPFHRAGLICKYTQCFYFGILRNYLYLTINMHYYIWTIDLYELSYMQTWTFNDKDILIECIYYNVKCICHQVTS